MKTYTTDPNKRTSHPSWRGIVISGLITLAATSLMNAEVVFETGFEDMPTGTLSSTTSPNWEGMLEGNKSGQDPSDWTIVDTGGLTYVARDGGVIEGGNKHYYVYSISNVTGRTYYDFENPLPTDIGQATSIYLSFVASFDQFEHLGIAPNEDESCWPVIRFNGSWNMRAKLAWRNYPCPDCTEARFHLELHDDVDQPTGGRTVAFVDDKLGEPQPMTPYLVVMRYDFDAAGVLLGQAGWVNPNFADKDVPDGVSHHSQPGYDTFVNPLVSMDITVYWGHVRFDNIKIATEWEDIVPQAGGSTWGGYAVDENGNINTDMWMGYLNVTNDPWIYSYDLGSYIYMEEAFVAASGSWAYVPK